MDRVEKATCGWLRCCWKVVESGWSGHRVKKLLDDRVEKKICGWPTRWLTSAWLGHNWRMVIAQLPGGWTGWRRQLAGG